MARRARMAAWIFAAAIAIAASGPMRCSEDGPKPLPESRPISNTEALEFGKGLADALARFDAEAVERAMDMDAMMEAAMVGVSAPSGFRKTFLDGSRKVQERDGPALLAEIRPVVEAGGDIRATKGIEWRGRPAFLLRIIQSDGVASYVLFMLYRGPDDRVRAVDYYSMASGELRSQALRRLYLAAVAQANRGVVDRLLGNDQSYIKHLEDLKRMTDAHREGRAQEVLTIYETLPEDVKNEKVCQVLRYSAAQKLGDDARYLESIQDFARRFPEDPARDFLMLDGYVLMDQLDKSLECLERLEKTLGGDAYLKVLRGHLMIAMDRPEDAIAAYRAAIADESDLRPAYDGLLDAAMTLERFGEVAETLDALESRFDAEIDDPSVFADFLASPEGKAWSEKRGEREPETREAEPAETREAGDGSPAKP